MPNNHQPEPHQSQRWKGRPSHFPMPREGRSSPIPFDVWEGVQQNRQTDGSTGVPIMGRHRYHHHQRRGGYRPWAITMQKTNLLEGRRRRRRKATQSLPLCQ